MVMVRPIGAGPSAPAGRISLSLTQSYDGRGRLAGDDPHQEFRPLIERDLLRAGVEGAIVNARNAGAMTTGMSEHGLDYVRRDFEPVVQDGADRPAQIVQAPRCDRAGELAVEASLAAGP